MAEKDNQKKFDALGREVELKLESAFIQSLNQFTARLATVEISFLLAGEAGTVVKFLGLKQDDLEEVRSVLDEAHKAGGQVAFNTIPVKQKNPSGTKFNRVFTGTKPEDIRAVSKHMAQLIKDTNPSTKRAVRSTILEGIKQNRAHPDIARDLIGVINLKTGGREGGILGLTGKDARTVQTMARGMREGDPRIIKRYFNLKGRNIKLDDLIKKEFALRGKLSESTIQKMRTGLRNRYLFNRGRTIARTESLKALTEGRFMGYDRMIKSGIVDKGTLFKTWNTFIDANTRASHSAIDDQRVKYDEFFLFLDGTIMKYPRDSNYGASLGEVINCRCFASVEMEFIKF